MTLAFLCLPWVKSLEMIGLSAAISMRSSKWRAFCCGQLMYHGKMTAHIYNIWSLAYWTHSLVFVRHCNDLLCGLFSYNDPYLFTYLFLIIVSYHFYLSQSCARPSDLNVAIEKGTIIGIQSGYSEDTVRIQGGYREDTVRIQGGYSQDTGRILPVSSLYPDCILPVSRIKGGYREDTVRIQSGYREDTVRIQGGYREESP